MSIDRTEILIVDHDDGLRDILGRTLDYAGYVTVDARTKAEGEAILARRQPNLILVDVNLPDGDGLDLVRDIHRHSRMPIVIHTERGTDVDVIVGLHHGADDYIVKPCGSAEVLARIRAILRRSGDGSEPSGKWKAEDQEIARFADLTLDCSRHLLERDGRRPIQLSRTEFVLLMAFLELPHKPLPRKQILAAIWPGNEHISENAIRTNISRLRRKFDRGQSSRSLITTVRGYGYVFSADVSWIRKRRRNFRGMFGPIRKGDHFPSSW